MKRSLNVNLVPAVEIVQGQTIDTRNQDDNLMKNYAIANS